MKKDNFKIKNKQNWKKNKTKKTQINKNIKQKIVIFQKNKIVLPPFRLSKKTLNYLTFFYQLK